MSENNHGATHAATPARLDRAKRDGDIAKSRELASAIQLVFVVGAMFWLSSNFVGTASGFAAEVWSGDLSYSYDSQDFQQQIVSAGLSMGVMLLPLLAAVLISAVVSNLIQTGPIFLTKRIGPDVTRLSPANWFKRMFSGPGLARTILGLPKFLVVITMSGALLWHRRDELVLLSTQEIETLVPSLISLILGVAIWVAVTLLLISSLDYFLERASHAARLRMSDRELRDEQRTQSIDPMLTTRRRQIHRDLRG